MCFAMLRLVTAESSAENVNRKSDRDIILAVRLERRLQCEMQMSARVHVSDDQVQLFGEVASWYRKQQAQELARELAPQYRIRNDIRVGVVANDCANG
jgi:osmotically-inducible protein OsmY